LVSDSEKATALAHADVLINTLFYTESSDTRGTELELVGSPVKGWTISVNYSKNESTRAGLAKEWRNYLNHWKPYWLQFGDLSLSQNVNLPGAELSASPADFRTPDEILATADYTINRDSVLEAVVDAESEFYEGVEKFDGNRFIGDPKHNYNLRTRYDFSQGKLKGLSVGLGVRIRTGRVAGAKTSFSVPAGSDYTAEKNGREISAITIVEAEDQNVYDAQIGYKMKLFNGKVRWDIQLNVNNLTNERKLITQTSHAVTLAPLLARYQDPRQFILTNTFSF
jgi:outer membrane receptor protein involved in Fe transport